MIKKREEKEIRSRFRVGMGGILKGLGDLVEKLGDLAETGEQLSRERRDSRSGQGGEGNLRVHR